MQRNVFLIIFLVLLNNISNAAACQNGSSTFIVNVNNQLHGNSNLQNLSVAIVEYAPTVPPRWINDTNLGSYLWPISVPVCNGDYLVIYSWDPIITQPFCIINKSESVSILGTPETAHCVIQLPSPKD